MVRLPWFGLRAPHRVAARRDPLGPHGERLAARCLKRKRYRVLERNVSIAGGEIDLVCLAPDRHTIVIVEVKARRLPADGSTPSTPPPEAQLHLHKRRMLLRLAQHLTRARGWHDRPIRIDLIALDVPARGRAIIRHHENAVTLNDAS